MNRISFIIVTFNSNKYIDSAINSILEQRLGNYRILIIDNNSENTQYLEDYNNNDKIDIFLLTENTGYCGGNNFGIYKAIKSTDLLIIMNPDIILPNNFVVKLNTTIQYLKENGLKFGAIGPKLVNSSNDSDCQYIDSTGIFQRWYGKWYDRGHQKKDTGLFDYSTLQEVPAICGALMILNPVALDQIKISVSEYFNLKYFMYKEDIDLSLRLSNAGYPVYYYSGLIVTHFRGWKSRRDILKKFKIMSARNEYQINKKLGVIKRSYSKIKLILANQGI